MSLSIVASDVMSLIASKSLLLILTTIRVESGGLAVLIDDNVYVEFSSNISSAFCSVIRVASKLE